MAVIIFEGMEKFNRERFLFLSVQQFEHTHLWGDFLIHCAFWWDFSIMSSYCYFR